MGSSKIKDQGESQGHVTSTLMCFFEKKKYIYNLATPIAGFGI